MVPKVAVILLNWNGWQDTVNCLRSLQSLDYPNFEPIVVDNGSDDDSVERIRSAYPDANLLETGANLGFGGGCNFGIRYALEHGVDYVWLLNNDTVVETGALKALVQTAEKESGIGGVGSVLYRFDQPDRVQALGGGNVSLWLGTSRNICKNLPDKRLDYITGASMLIRHQVLQEVGVFNERDFFMYWEDADLCFRIRRAGWLLAVAPNSLIWHKESACLSQAKPIQDFYSSWSATVFFRLHAAIPAIPIMIGLGTKLAKRIIFGDFHRASAVWKGLSHGLGKTLS